VPKPDLLLFFSFADARSVGTAIACCPLNTDTGPEPEEREDAQNVPQELLREVCIVVFVG
jgi:hypothetical protein